VAKLDQHADPLRPDFLQRTIELASAIALQGTENLGGPAFALHATQDTASLGDLAAHNRDVLLHPPMVGRAVLTVDAYPKRSKAGR